MRRLDPLFSIFYNLVGFQQEKTSLGSQLWPVILFIIDTFQIWGLAVSWDYAWPDDFRRLFNDIHLERDFPEDDGEKTYFFTAGALNLVIFLMVGLMGYVHYLSTANAVRSMYPVYILRFLLRITSTALFVPIMGFLFRTIGCTQLYYYHVHREDLCWSAEHSTIVAFSALSTLIFLPMVAMAQVAFSDISPTSVNPEAQNYSFSNILYTGIRLVVVFCTVFSSNFDTANAAFFSVLFLIYGLYLAARLPYYHLKYNMFRVGMAMFTFLLFLMSAVMSSYRDEALKDRLIIAWVTLALGILLSVGSGFLVKLRFDYIKREVLKFERLYSGANGTYEGVFTDTAEDEEDEYYSSHRHRYYDDDDDYNFTSSKKSMGFAKHRTNVAGKNKLDEPEFHYYAATDVELYVRAMMDLDKTGKRAQRYAKFQHSKRAIAMMHATFRDGVEWFDSVAQVHIAYALYIDAFEDNQVNALNERNISTHCHTFDLISRYQVYCANHDSARAVTNRGAANGIDSVAMVEYKNLMKSANVSQLQALEETSRFWSNLSKWKNRPIEASKQIERIMKARDKASAALESLLLKYPNSVEVLRAYATFLINVMDEDTIARDYIMRADLLEKEQSKAISGDHSHSDGTSLSRGSSVSHRSSWKVTQRKLRDSDRSIGTIEYKMILSILLILLSLSVSFTYVVLRMEGLQETISNLNLAGSRRKHTAYTGFGARILQIGAMNDNPTWIAAGQNILASGFKGLRGAHPTVYMEDLTIPDAKAFDRNEKYTTYVPLYDLNGDVRKATQTVSLWEFGNQFIKEGKLLHSSSPDTLKTPHSQFRFLYILWNTIGLLDTFERSMAVLEHNVFDDAHESMVWIIALISLVIICVIGMVMLVFRPAMKGVEKSMENVHSIMWQVPHHVVSYQKRIFTQRVVKERARQDLTGGMMRHRRHRQHRGTMEEPIGEDFMGSKVHFDHHERDSNEHGLLPIENGSPRPLPGLSPLPSPRPDGDDATDQAEPVTNNGKRLTEESHGSPPTSPKHLSLPLGSVSRDGASDADESDEEQHSQLSAEEAAVIDPEANEEIVVTPRGRKIVRKRASVRIDGAMISKRKSKELDGNAVDGDEIIDDESASEQVRSPNPLLDRVKGMESSSTPRSRSGRRKVSFSLAGSATDEVRSERMVHTTITLDKHYDSDDSEKGQGQEHDENGSDTHETSEYDEEVVQGRLALRKMDSRRNQSHHSSMKPPTPIPGHTRRVGGGATKHSHSRRKNARSFDIEMDEFGTDEEEDVSRKDTLAKKMADASFQSGEATRKFSLRLYIVCLIIIVAASGLTIISVISLEDGKYLSADLNNGGRRRFIPANIAHMATECFVGDGIMFDDTDSCIDFLRMRIDFFETVHNGLQTGNSAMNLKGADGRNSKYDYVMYKRECLAFGPNAGLCDPSNPREDVTYGRAIVSEGYDSLIKSFLAEARTVGDIVEQAVLTNNYTATYDIDSLTTHDEMNFIRTVSTRDMAWGAALTAEIIDEEVATVFSSFRVTTALVFSCTSALIVIVYMFLLRPLVSLLKSETARQWDLLLLIPEDVIMEKPELSKYFNIADEVEQSRS